MVIPVQIEKCKGAMVACAIGDALGWPNEPRSKNRAKKPKVTDEFVAWIRSSNNPRWHDERILPGEYSDDTQMILSVARSIITGDWERFFAEKELPFWLNYERGGGGALLKAAKSYKKGLSPWQSEYARDYFNAGGNGAAMRILPHVIASAKTPDTARLMMDVIKNTRITHGHPRAFLGATCYAYALDYLLRKDTVLEYGELITAIMKGQEAWGMLPGSDILGEWIDIAQKHCEFDFWVEWESTRTRMVRQLEFIEESLKKGLILDDTKVLTDLECFGKANGAGDVAALAAIYLASRYANNPSLGIKIPAFSFGADTDTIASITGGLLGMLSGTSWIPEEWKMVQDYDCLLQMTELLLADNKKEATKKEVAGAKAQNNRWNITPIGKMRLVDEKNVPNGKNGVVLIKKWQTTLGQTLYTKTFQPKDKENQPLPYVELPQAGRQLQPEKQLQPNASLKEQRKFVLNPEGIADLLDNPKFKTNITVGKVLKIIGSLMEGKETSVDIARQFHVEPSVVEQIEKYIQNE